MTALLTSVPYVHCQANRQCDRAPCFQARFEAIAGHRAVQKDAELCAEHLGGMVHALATWAPDQGLEGKVTVLAIDEAASRQTTRPDDLLLHGFAFGTILVNSYTSVS